jgi:hypothetical protein
VIDDGRCPFCGYMDWHNAWLCQTCGGQSPKQWAQYIHAGYIKDTPRRQTRRRKQGLPDPRPMSAIATMLRRMVPLAR